MVLNRVQRDILESGKEDYSGLWEAVDLARAAHPELDEPQLRKIAAHELVELVMNGLLEFYRGTKFAGEQVPSNNIDDALAHEASWDGNRPIGAEHYRFASTPQGVSALGRG